MDHILSHSEGRYANVTDVGAGMRWTRAARETGVLVRTGKSCGPDIFDADVKLAVIPASDGGTVIAGEITE